MQVVILAGGLGTRLQPVTRDMPKVLVPVCGRPFLVYQLEWLASYGLSYYALGRLSAKHVQRVLLGAAPGDLPVEQVDRLHFVINLKTAKALGLTIPQSVLARADEVIE